MLRSNIGGWAGSTEQAIEAVFQDCQYIEAANSRGTLRLSVHRGKLRFRLIQNDGTVLHTSHISDRKKIASQLIDFSQTTQRDFPRHFKFGDYGKVQFDFEAELAQQDAERIRQKAQQDAERLRQEALRRKRARIQALVRLAAVAALILGLAACGFGALFKKFEIYPPTAQAEIIALPNPADLAELLHSSKFSLRFSNLVSSVEQRITASGLKEDEVLDKQKQFISARDAQISDLGSLGVREFVERFWAVAPERFVELTNVLYSLELRKEIVSAYSPPARNSDRVPRTFLSAKEIAEVGRAFGMRMSESDALSWKYNLPSRSEVEAEQRHNKDVQELKELRLKAQQLESDLRARVQAAFSNACDQKIESLRTNEFAEVKTLRTAASRDIHEFERAFLSDCSDRSWVFPIPFSHAVFASRRSQILIAASADAHTTSHVILPGEEPHRELLFDFLKREFSRGK